MQTQLCAPHSLMKYIGLLVYVTNLIGNVITKTLENVNIKIQPFCLRISKKAVMINVYNYHFNVQRLL